MLNSGRRSYFLYKKFKLISLLFVVWAPTLIEKFILKGQCHEIFCFWFFSRISFPQAPEYTVRTVSSFFENSRRYSQLKADHRYQRHRRQILPPVSLVLLIPVANLPPVSTIPAANLPSVSTTPVAGINDTGGKFCHQFH